MILLIPDLFETGSLMYPLVDNIFREQKKSSQSSLSIQNPAILYSSSILQIPGQDAKDESFVIGELNQKVVGMMKNKELDQRNIGNKMVQNQNIIQAKILKDKKIHLITSGYGSIIALNLLIINPDLFGSIFMVNFQNGFNLSLLDTIQSFLGLPPKVEMEFQKLQNLSPSLLSKKAFRSKNIREKTKYTLIQEYPYRLGIKSYIEIIKSFEATKWLKNLSSSQKTTLSKLPIKASIKKDQVDRANSKFENVISFVEATPDYFYEPETQGSRILDFYSEFYPNTTGTSTIIF